MQILKGRVSSELVNWQLGRVPDDGPFRDGVIADIKTWPGLPCEIMVRANLELCEIEITRTNGEVVTVSDVSHDIAMTCIK